MIKFIMQRYANPNGTEQANSINNNKTTPIIQINQSSIALKNLRQTQDQVQALKRRLSVLTIKDQKYQQKTKSNQRRIQFHSMIQDSIAKAKKNKQNHMEKVNKDILASKERILMYRQQRNQNLSRAKSNLMQNKRMDRSRIRQNSQQNEKNLYKRRIQQLSSKMQRRSAISKMQKLQKQHIAQYFFKKKMDFRQSCARQSSLYDSRRSNRQKLLEQLSARQSMMIQRQSSSRAALDETSKRVYRLEPILKAIKRQKSTSDFSGGITPVLNKSTQQYVFL